MSGIGTGVRRRAARGLGTSSVPSDHLLCSSLLLWPPQYDLSTGTFSPDGRVFQTDYAQKAVDNSGCGRVAAGAAPLLPSLDKALWRALIETFEFGLVTYFDSNHMKLPLLRCSTVVGIRCKDGVVLVRPQQQLLPLVCNAISSSVHACVEWLCGCPRGPLSQGTPVCSLCSCGCSCGNRRMLSTSPACCTLRLRLPCAHRLPSAPPRALPCRAQKS